MGVGVRAKILHCHYATFTTTARVVTVAAVSLRVRFGPLPFAGVARGYCLVDVKGAAELGYSYLQPLSLAERGEECLAETLAFMELAIQQAKLALDVLEVPVGCVIVEDGKLIASGRNRTTESRNATRHAEMEAIDLLLEQWKKNGLSISEVAEKFSSCSLYVTCEPCIMCASALSILGIKDVYYGCANDKFGGCGSILSLNSEVIPGKGFKCTGGIMASEAILLLRTFYEQGNPNAPKPHRPLTRQP